MKFKSSILCCLSLFFLMSSCSTNPEPPVKNKDDIVNQPPSSSNSFESIKAYMQMRDQWLINDSNENFSRGIKLTPKEHQLDHYLRRMVRKLQIEFLESKLFCPARNFLLAKTCVDNSPLFSFLKQMPKGAMLHIHSVSTGTAPKLIEQAIANENCYIYWEEGEREETGVLHGTMGCFLNDKVPRGYKSMGKLADEIPNFENQISALITLTVDNIDDSNPWQKFDLCFSRVKNLLLYKPFFMEYYRQAFETLAEDKIQLVELRVGLKPLWDASGRKYTKSDTIAFFREVMGQVREKYPHFNLKLIISNLRSTNLFEERILLEDAFKMRSEYPDMVVGYDLVGPEATGNTTLYYVDNLLDAAEGFSKKYKTDLPYYFHDGESNWETDFNLFDAVLLKSKRIGHGFNLFYFPWLVDQVKKQDICIEVCPISNQCLGFVEDLRLHPAIGYLKQGIQCVLSSDDPFMFTTRGLSYDFWEAIMAWNLHLADIKQLCMNSINYSSLNAAEKKEAMERWMNDWDAFVHKAVAELIE